MGAVEKTHRDITMLYNIMHSLYNSLNYQQIILHTGSILANLWDSLYYMREVAIHTMDWIDAATTGILSPNVLLLKIWGKCYQTLRKCFLLPCTYQFHQKLHSISTDIYVPASWLLMNNSYYWSMYQYRIMHNKWKYMKYLIWIYLREISQHAMTYNTSTWT